MKTPRAATALLLSATLASGCVRSYKSEPTLPFQEFPYTSTQGQAWPLKRVALPKTAEAYQVATVPEVAYVELNPEGKQTLVFIHGLGSYLKFWRYQLDAFAAQGYRVVAVDLPGYGKSDKLATFPYSMEAMADAVRELVTLLGVEKPVLVGHSMGGMTALSYAIRYPEEPGALVLTAPAGFEKFSWKEKAWLTRAFSTTLVKSAPEYGIWGSVAQSNFSRWRPELEWLVEERVRVVGSQDFDSYAYANVRTVKGLAHNDFVRENLGRIQAPTIIVFGEDDRLIPNPFMHGGRAREVMEYGHAGIRGSELVGFERCGHSVQLDCPEEYNAAVSTFLRKLPAPADSAPKQEQEAPPAAVESPPPAP
ncbi:alpha/beta fold hydrolase [Hyalangium rubrum]|uniref:Alpha/beta hydrolase n=1 Tax=Hyalangium rubrum TaxID=3103134 RepID=A0ABU5GZ82_9BACT|nr:alpha/beta hydrolase [Hyalangium sp. s54d21]MDY7226366.1 alpha/beta hydrolase [Hyalangium sp. s54d21]